MKPDALRAFETVVELGSLNAAARVLNLSEPALSRKIAALEAELDLVLFDRSRRQLRPTETGRAFLQEVQPILSGLRRITDFADEIRAGARRRLRLISMPRLSTAITGPVIAAFKKAHPDVALSVDIQPRRLLETWITGQRFDLGLSTLPAQHPDIDTRLLFELPAVAVLPVGHRLAGATALTVEDLADDPFIALTVGTALRRQVEAIFGHANAVLKPAVEVSQTHLACQLVSLGAGVTICDPMVPTGFPGRLAVVPITPWYPMAFGMHFLRGRPSSPEAKALEAIVRERADAFLEETGFTQ
ncbi:LysR family transcriptional regulator [Cognatiyoonia sp. IB215182]|uniref:LysR family transcriptional regulator n=1 Tax=Cognatiyoonia sp. IB215182 TaxID=3097353 RepID=UPI002A1755D1|nr:LysR family transcriptional regulator [Cognatiyoonia sp. IB215182]MDX8352452.1 LysR family transcriptional regulator [Cognatiyoonia sp. IB215182]